MDGVLERVRGQKLLREDDDGQDDESDQEVDHQQPFHKGEVRNNGGAKVTCFSSAKNTTLSFTECLEVKQPHLKTTYNNYLQQPTTTTYKNLQQLFTTTTYNNYLQQALHEICYFKDLFVYLWYQSYNCCITIPAEGAYMLA